MSPPPPVRFWTAMMPTGRRQRSFDCTGLVTRRVEPRQVGTPHVSVSVWYLLLLVVRLLQSSLVHVQLTLNSNHAHE